LVVRLADILTLVKHVLVFEAITVLGMILARWALRHIFLVNFLECFFFLDVLIELNELRSYLRYHFNLLQQYHIDVPNVRFNITARLINGLQ